MKSASNFWILFFFTSLLFNCASRKPSDSFPMQKAYVLLRTEGLEAEINELTSVLNSNFVTNKIASDINYYPLGRTWNNNQIFSTAYNNNYDYIILIDQVAKFTIDNKTNVGGKYQIRSYHIKSTNPDWVDLGQKTCNVSVRQSIDKLSQQIISQIVPNYIPSKVGYNNDHKNSKKQQTQISEIDYNQLKSSKEIDVELEELRKQLEIEKERTNKATAEKEQLEKEYEQTLSFQKTKNQTVLEGLESFKKDQELAEATRLEEIGKEKLAIAETKKLETQHVKKQQHAEAKNNEKKPKTSLKKKQKKSSNKTKESSMSLNKSTDKSNALLIIRGNEEDFSSFNKLKDRLELELLYANIRTTTQILNLKEVVIKEDLLSFNQPNYNYLIFIEQLDTIDDGSSNFGISIYPSSSNSTWKDLEQRPFNLNNKKSLKEFSKTVLKSL